MEATQAFHKDFYHVPACVMAGLDPAIHVFGLDKTC
jgi:hypothetical protein